MRRGTPLNGKHCEEVNPCVIKMRKEGILIVRKESIL